MTTTNHKFVHTTLNKHIFCGSPRDPPSQAGAAEHLQAFRRRRPAPAVAQRGARKEPPGLRQEGLVFDDLWRSSLWFTLSRDVALPFQKQRSLSQCVPSRLATPWGHIKRLASNLGTQRASIHHTRH